MKIAELQLNTPLVFFFFFNEIIIEVFEFFQDEAKLGSTSFLLSTSVPVLVHMFDVGGRGNFDVCDFNRIR